MTALPHEAYLACMAGLPWVGPVTLRRLAGLGPVERTWSRLVRGQVPTEVLPPVSVGAAALVRSWARAAGEVDPSRHWDELRAAGVGVTSLGSPGYPAALTEDPDPPVVLFHLGDPSVVAAPCVAVVGTRRPTGYGREVAHTLGAGLSALGVCVVSGLALGIDAAAHAGAVGGGAPVAPPVAVVGAGLDAPCPSANRPLARRVAASGMVCSEVPLGVPAAPWRFPVRNRIVAALARVVVVVESGATGGSMSTVEHALRRDRTVLAVPGPVGAPTSEGTNRLIADGAGVCTGVDDVLAALGRDVAPPGRGSRPALSAPSGLAGRLLDLLGWRPETPDHLVRVSGADPRAVARAVEQLVEVGLVVRRGGFVERCAGPAPDRPT